jgi:hypothetical protein
MRKGLTVSCVKSVTMSLKVFYVSKLSPGCPSLDKNPGGVHVSSIPLLGYRFMLNVGLDQKYDSRGSHP